MARQKYTLVDAQSSSDEVPGLPALQAIDGDLHTRWSSGVYDPNWIYVDLGSSQLVDAVRLNWEVASSTDYDIDVSDNTSSWITLATVQDPTSMDHREDWIPNLNTSARYVRMYSRSRFGPFWGNSIYEFEVFGPDSPEAPVLVPVGYRVFID